MIYFYHGENKFALGRQVDNVIAKFSEQHGVDAITRLDASETTVQNLIAEIVNVNMFAPRRLIIVRGFENAGDSWEKIGENLDRVSDETDLLIVASKPDKRTKTYKNLLKVAKTREFPLLKPYELKSWLLDETKTIKIDADAIDELLLITGGEDDQQARLSAEIAKFQVLKKPVDVDLMRQIVEPNLATNAFAILNLAITGKSQELAAELKNLRTSGEDANKFFGLIASQVFALAAAVFADSSADTARNLKIHPFQLSKMRDLARELGDLATAKRRVKKITKILADTDAKMKMSRADVAWDMVGLALVKITF
jgi:DNA polymerase-3 subunit delta